MRRKLLARLLIVTCIGLPVTAMASEMDCFPLCDESANAQAKAPTDVQTNLDGINVSLTREAAVATASPASCESSLMKSAEDMNEKVKPIREIIGYVRSPQSLAIKLVNDHIVKIPAWIGYAMDPLGAIKRQVIGEVRTRAKDAMASDNACVIVPSEDSLAKTEAIDMKHST